MKYSKAQLVKETIKQRGFIGKIPAVWRMLKSWAKGNYKTNTWRMVFIILGFLYILSPLDFLPEALPFVGVIDDLTILAFLIPKLMKEVDDFLQWEISDKQ